MLTYSAWSAVMANDMWEIFFTCFLSIFSIPIDLILSPLEIVALIIYKTLNKK